MIDNSLFNCSDERLIVETVEGPSALPLGIHSVHIPEAGVIVPG